MKNIYFLFCFLFFASCTSLDKMLEQDKYEEVFELSSQRLKRGKVKWKNLSAFEKSFAQLNNQDLDMIERMRSQEQANLWPRIHQVATYIADRQDRIVPILQRVADTYSEPAVTLYPIEDLLEEAAEKSAVFFYASAIEYLEQARKGNRQLARKAFDYIRRCRSYRPDYRDAPALEEELYELGTTHVQLQPVVSSKDPRFEGELLLEVIGSKSFPFRQGWQVIHAPESPEVERIHYYLEMAVEDISVSGDYCNSSSCSESAEVENGTITKQEWSAQDSAWVTIEEVQYLTVNVRITTYDQSKSASLRVNTVLLDAATLRPLDQQSWCRGDTWNHSYSKLSGDDRALNSCKHIGGIAAFFPNGTGMLFDAARSISYLVYQDLEEGVDAFDSVDY